MTGNRCENRYRMVRMLASGSFGEVRVAKDQFLNRDVAIKVIHARFMDNPSVIDRFVQEAEALAHLEHPNIVPIYDSGRLDDGRPYFSIRLIEGGTLEQAAARFHETTRRTPAAEKYGSPEFRSLLTCLRDASQAIAFAHSKGIVHRDVKPSNILVNPEGQTFVIDWGTAKGMNQPRSQRAVDMAVTMVPGQERKPAANLPSETQYGMILGTPAFMSPEQALGLNDVVSPQSDVYGLGAALYFIVTGRPPHKGDSVAEVLGKAQKGEITGPKAIVDNVPEQLVHICDHALQSDPQNRYPSVQNLLDDLERYLSTEQQPKAPVVSKPLGNQGSSSDSGAPWLWVAMIFGALFVLSIAVGFVGNRIMIGVEQDKVAQLERDLNTAHSVITNKERKADDSGPSVDPALLDAANTKVEELENELQAAQEDANDASSQLEELRADQSEWKQQKTSFERSNSELQNRIDSIESESRQQLAEKQHRIDQLIVDLNDLQDDLEEQLLTSDSDNRVDSLMSELELVKAELNNRMAELDDNERELRDRELELRRSNESLERRTSELTIANQHLVRLNNRVDELERLGPQDSKDSLVASHFEDDELVTLLKPNFDAKLIHDDRILLTVKGLECHLYVDPDGNLLLASQSKGDDWTIELANKWNEYYRWSRVYLTDQQQIVVESDLAVSDGVSETRVLQFVAEFGRTLDRFANWPDGGDNANAGFLLESAPPAPDEGERRLDFNTFGR